MSEYQWYEFVALDRPLTAKEMSALRGISTRASISPTRFWNEYHWGDLRADPAKLLERYFDVHLYFANWGTRRLMLRLPAAKVARAALVPYFVGSHAARLAKRGAYLVLDLVNEPEDPEYDDENEVSLAAISGVRAELLRGDLRPAYLAWVLSVQAGEVDEAETEPPFPAGLGELTPSQSALASFLRIDRDLLAAASRGSCSERHDRKAFQAWVGALSERDKEAWLMRAAEEPGLAVGSEMLRVFRAQAKEDASLGRRTVADLLALAEGERTQRERRDAARAERVRRAAEAARERRLSKLARDLESAWAELERLVEARRYDEGLELATDLRGLAARQGEEAAFVARLQGVRKRLPRRRGFFDRWKRAVLLPAAVTAMRGSSPRRWTFRVVSGSAP